MIPRRAVVAVAAVALALTITGAQKPAAAEDHCAGGVGWGPFPALERAARALAARRELLVVALGSSSTLGVGATAPDRSYPARLEAVLRGRFPRAAVRVVNRGVGGETVADNLARLGRDVLDLRPDLLVWQVGTNDALRGVAPGLVVAQVLGGVAAVRAAGAEVALMAPQPLPEPERDRRVRTMGDALRAAAHAARVPYLDRHALMRRWLEVGWTPPELFRPDRLHMTDASYACLALRVADLLPATLSSPVLARLTPTANAPRAGR